MKKTSNIKTMMQQLRRPKTTRPLLSKTRLTRPLLSRPKRNRNQTKMKRKTTEKTERTKRTTFCKIKKSQKNTAPRLKATLKRSLLAITNATPT